MRFDGCALERRLKNFFSMKINSTSALTIQKVVAFFLESSAEVNSNLPISLVLNRCAIFVYEHLPLKYANFLSKLIDCLPIDFKVTNLRFNEKMWNVIDRLECGSLRSLQK